MQIIITHAKKNMRFRKELEMLIDLSQCFLEIAN